MARVTPRPESNGRSMSEFSASDICVDVSERIVRKQMRSRERDKQTTSQRGAKGVTIAEFRKGRETP